MDANILVLNIVGLRAEFLGPYGNDWIDTPSFNRLAVRGFTFDHCLAGSPQLSAQLPSLWSACHPTQSHKLARQQAASQSTWPIDAFRDAGWHTVLISSSHQTRGVPGADRFAEHRLVRSPRGQCRDLQPSQLRLITDAGQLEPCGEPANDWSETQTAAVFSELSGIIAERPEKCLVWCEISTLREEWDAPLEVRDRFREPGDPPLWEGTDIPRVFLSRQADPDLLLPFIQAYAAQVYLLDLCLGGLLEMLLDAESLPKWVVVVTSSLGLPLGEHGYLGPWDTPLHAELLHVPLILACPDGVGQAERSQALVYPHDVMPTLQHLFNLAADDQDYPASIAPSSAAEPPATASRVWIAGRSLLPIIQGEHPSIRDRLFIWDYGERLAIRTAAWFAQIRLTNDEGDGSIAENWPAMVESFVRKIAVQRQTPSQEEDAEPAWDDISYLEIDELRRQVRLYVKPDDRWEVNEVADRCPDVASKMLRVGAEFLEQIMPPDDDVKESIASPPLPAELAKGVEA